LGGEEAGGVVAGGVNEKGHYPLSLPASIYNRQKNRRKRSKAH